MAWDQNICILCHIWVEEKKNISLSLSVRPHYFYLLHYVTRAEICQISNWKNWTKSLEPHESLFSNMYCDASKKSFKIHIHGNLNIRYDVLIYWRIKQIKQLTMFQQCLFIFYPTLFDRNMCWVIMGSYLSFFETQAELTNFPAKFA